MIRQAIAYLIAHPPFAILLILATLSLVSRVVLLFS